MKKTFFIICFIFAVSPYLQQIYGQSYFDINLWEKGLPNTNGADQFPYDDMEKNFKPSIRIFLPDKNTATGRAVLACPGGAYRHLAYNHEGTDWASFYNKLGIALIVLKYRMPKGVNKDVPISDAEEAMRVIRANAKKWNINTDDVGIMGSSAGGHLASTIATHAKAEARPNFQILFYPVITMDWTYTNKASRENLLGENPSGELIELYSNEKQVSAETPRAFIAYSDDDGTTKPLNGINYYLALKKYKIPASLYIYPSGGHGWGIKDSFFYKEEMLQNLKSWLQSF
jgi:acetyl esterase/lipase